MAGLAAEAGRPIAFLGRRMIDNTETALDLGLLQLGGATRVEPGTLGDAFASRALVFVSGSQGEPLSALSMISLGEHRDVAAGPGDTVVLSARVIPGNERVVSRLISNLYRRGCDVVHPGTARVHVSGHGSRDDLVELLRLVRPRYLVPVHGEYRMLAQHARLAAQAGLPADRVLLAEDGDVLAFPRPARATRPASRPGACCSTARRHGGRGRGGARPPPPVGRRHRGRRASSSIARPASSSRRPRS